VPPGEPLVQRTRYWHSLCNLHVSHARRPFRIRHDHFVAWLEQRLTGDEHAVDSASRHHYLVRASDRDAVLLLELFGKQLEQVRKARRLQVVAPVFVDGAMHRRLDGFGRVEADVALIEAERVLDAVHHVADADDAGKGDGVEELTHDRMLTP